MQIYILDIDVFSEQDMFEKIFQLLPEERKNKIRSMKHEQGKQLSAAAGYLLLYGLWQNGYDYESVSIQVGEHGKPFVASDERLFFNLSHSGSKAVCVIADRECGIDIEQIQNRKISDTLLKKVCTAQEYIELVALNEVEQRKAFIRLWTAKESVMKYTGLGIGMSPENIEFHKNDVTNVMTWNGHAIHTYEIEDYYISVCC